MPRFTFTNSTIQQQYHHQHQHQHRLKEDASTPLVRGGAQVNRSDSFHHHHHHHSPYDASSFNFKRILHMSSRSTLDPAADPSNYASQKSLFLGKTIGSPLPAGGGSGSGNVSSGSFFKSPQRAVSPESPVNLLRERSFYRELRSSRSSTTRKSLNLSSASQVSSPDELKFKRVIDTYRQSKHSLFTLVQNEVSSESVARLDELEAKELLRIMPSARESEQQTGQSLEQLSDDYKQMHNKLSKLIHGDKPKGTHVLLHDGSTSRHSLARGSVLFFRMERKNLQLGILRIVAKQEDGDAKLYASATFEFPNYANNSLKHASMVGETCYFYFHPDEPKARTVYLSVEALKTTLFSIQVKFVRTVDQVKRVETRELAASQTQQQAELELIQQLKGDTAAGALFKAFMQGKLDEGARQEVLQNALRVRLEKQKMLSSLKSKVRDDLLNSHYAVKWQRKKEYFDKQRYRSEVAKSRRQELLHLDRKHKVALMNKSEIYRYLRNLEGLKLRRKKMAQFFARVWSASSIQMRVMGFVTRKFEVGSMHVGGAQRNDPRLQRAHGCSHHPDLLPGAPETQHEQDGAALDPRAHQQQTGHALPGAPGGRPGAAQGGAHVRQVHRRHAAHRAADEQNREVRDEQ